MSVEQEIRSLLASGNQAEAVAKVTALAQDGDDWSSLCLAEWKLMGQGVARDLEGAVALFEAAAGRGYEAAAYRLTTLYATGTGCLEQPEKARNIIENLRHRGNIIEAQAAFLEENIEPSDDYRCKVLSESPDVRLFHNVLSPKECSWIRTLSAQYLQPSLVNEPGTGRRIPDPVRTSDGMSFGPLQEDLVINRINRRIARLSDSDYSWGEPLHVLRYLPGQQYRQHYDALPGVLNQRQLTAILYCNSGYDGGETSFPDLDLQVKGSEGDMLLFSNLASDGRQESASKHAGLPVTKGEKWVATRWIRQSRYHPWR